MKKHQLFVLAGTTVLAAFFFAVAPAADNDSASFGSVSDYFAEIDQLGQETVTALKKRQRVMETPSNISVITAQQIKEWGCRNLKDVIRKVAGYQVIPDRDEFVVAARGNVADNDQKYMILIDGHNMNSIENFGPGHIIERPNDLSMVERVEVIRGPGSAVWGSDAMAGIINIITKDVTALEGKRATASFAVNGDPEYKDKGFDANFQFGKEISPDVNALFMGSFSSQEGRVTAQSASSNVPRVSFRPLDTNMPGTFNTLLENLEPSYQFLFKAKAGDFGVKAFVFSNEFFDRHYECDSNRVNLLTNDKMFVESEWETKIRENIPITWKVSADQIRNAYFPKKGASRSWVWLDRRMSSSLYGSAPLLSNVLSVIAGIDYTFDKLGENTRFDSVSSLIGYGGRFMDPYRTGSNYGGYAMIQYDPLDFLSALGGCRLDYNTDRGADTLSLAPRASIIWKINNRASLKTIYNRGILRPANYQNMSGTVKSEVMDQVEAIYQQSVLGLNYTITGYWQKLKGFIAINATGNAWYNTGDYQSQGVETEAQYNLSEVQTLWGNFSFCSARGMNFPDATVLPYDARRIVPDASDSTRGKLLSYPAIAFNLGGTTRLEDGKYFFTPSLRFFGTTDYRSAKPSVNTSWAGAKHATVGPFYYLDATIGWEPEDYIGVYLYASNLLDVNDQINSTVWNGTVGQFGRTFELRVTYKY